MSNAPTDRRALVAGSLWCVLFHLCLGLLLWSATLAGKPDGASVSEALASQDAPRRRAAFGESALRYKRSLEGPYPRSRSFKAVRYARRHIFDVRGRRPAFDEAGAAYRFLELSRGRRVPETMIARKARGLDFGPADDNLLVAMVIPKLGLKKAYKYHLPRLTKYEQPERVEEAINIQRDNDSGQELKYKAPKKKAAQFDRKRKKKPSLSDLIDAPDDDDPRARASRLEEIVGVESGSVHGSGSDGGEGNVYLGQVQTAIQRAFNVPVFLSRDELRKLVVDIEIRQMDARGRILAYKLRKNSSSAAFDSAALEAIRRFVPSEGGSRSLPAPEAEMLARINKRGILVRLEGGKLK